MVVGFIFRSIEQRICSLGRLLFSEHQVDQLQISAPYGSGLKFGPLARIMAEPFAALRAWRNLLEPKIDPRTLSRKAHGAQPVDKETRPIHATRAFMHSLDFNPERTLPCPDSTRITIGNINNKRETKQSDDGIGHTLVSVNQPHEN